MCRMNAYSHGSGYKEFHAYLNASDPSEKLFQMAIERMKLSTRKYAKRQIGWIRNKLLPVVHAANAESISETGTLVTPTYLLDATGECVWGYTNSL